MRHLTGTELDQLHRLLLHRLLTDPVSVLGIPDRGWVHWLWGPMAWRWLPLGTGVLPWGLGGRPERWLQGCELHVLWWLVLGRLVLRCWEMLLRWWQWLEDMLMPFTAVDLVKGFIQEALKLADDTAVQVIGQLEQHWGDVLTVAAPHWIAFLSALEKIFDKNKQLILLFFCLLKLVRKLCVLVRFLPVVCVGGRHSRDIFCGWLWGQNSVGAELGIILAMGMGLPWAVERDVVLFSLIETRGFGILLSTMKGCRKLSWWWPNCRSHCVL